MNCSFRDNINGASSPTQVNGTHHTDETPPRLRQHSVVATPTPNEPVNVPTPTSMAEYPATQTVRFVTQRPFGLLDLELIHHYSTQTYITITSRLKSHIIWRDVIFREALRHDFLLDALMATSALHKATCQPETSETHAEYTRRALAYQNAALAGYIPALNNPSKDNSVALFAISVLLSVWSFGSKRLPEGLGNVSPGYSPALTVKERPDSASSPDDPIDFPSVISLMQLIQGVNAVIMQTMSWLREEVSELIRSPKDDDLPANALDVDASLELLAQRIQKACGPESGNSIVSEERHELYLERLQSLRQVARCRTVLEWDAYIFSWPVTAKPLYIDLLRQHEPVAMALFVHWAACIRCLDHLWWAKGWAYRLVRDVSSVLDGSWAECLIWPKRAVGLDFSSPGV